MSGKIWKRTSPWKKNYSMEIQREVKSHRVTKNSNLSSKFHGWSIRGRFSATRISSEHRLGNPFAQVIGKVGARWRDSYWSQTPRAFLWETEQQPLYSRSLPGNIMSRWICRYIWTVNVFWFVSSGFDCSFFASRKSVAPRPLGFDISLQSTGC